MTDETELARRRRLMEINLVPGSLSAGLDIFGCSWTGVARMTTPRKTQLA